MEEGGQQCSGAVEIPVGGHSNVVENVEASRQSVVTVLRNKTIQVLKAFLRMKASSVAEDMTFGLGSI